MIKTLQRKFVFSAMLAVTLLLVVLLGAINISNYIAAERQSERLMDMLIHDAVSPVPHGDKKRQYPQWDQESSGSKDQLFRSDEDERFDDHEHKSFFMHPLDENSRMAAVYFAVKTDKNGEIVQTDISHIASVTEEAAEKTAIKVMKQGEQSGSVDLYKYKTAELSDGGSIMLFLHTAERNHSVLRVLTLSLLGGLACWGLMLLLVFLLSKKAIRPIVENLERQKQFVTDAGHEIKTPLAIIMANAEALELRSGESKYSRNIKDQAARLGDLMQNLLTLSKIDETKKAMNLSRFNLSELFDDCVLMFEQSAELKGVCFEKSINPDIMITANRERIAQLFSILLDNAVKYSSENSIISAELKKWEKGAEICIVNSCDSLPDCDSKKLFDRFYRADSARTQKGGGYGIGLSAARAIAELHNGSIAAKYLDKDRIKFTVKLQ